MEKVFNTTAACIPEEHYMVDISARLKEIKSLVDSGKSAKRTGSCEKKVFR